MHRWRSATPWLLLALVGMLTAGAAWVGASGSGQAVAKKEAVACRFPDTGFGGYVERSQPHSISAEWRVPTIATTLGLGGASTWVGVQAKTRAFVQLGTDENQQDEGNNVYNAFWSDPTVGFHPRSMLTVAPGDTVTAAMTQEAEGWLLRFRDLTSGHSVKLVVHYAGNVPFDQAEWFQEDPAQAGCSNVPYPAVSTVTFLDVKANGRVQQIGDGGARVLESPNGVTLVPTDMAGGSFSVRRATGVEAQYLRDTSPFNFAIQALYNDWLTRRSDLVAAVTFRNDVQAMTASIKSQDDEMSSQTWPSAAKRYVKAFVAYDSVLLLDLSRLSQGSTLPAASAVEQFFRAERTVHNVSTPLRAAIGLPPVIPSFVKKIRP